MSKGYYLKPKDETKYNQAKQEFLQFLEEHKLEDLPNQDRLFEILIGTLEKVEQQKDENFMKCSTLTFHPATDLEQTAAWLYNGYRHGYVDDRAFDQTSREYYDTTRFRFGMHTDLATIGLGDKTMLRNTDPRLTTLFEYAIGTLHQKNEGKFEFMKGRGRELADRLRENYRIESDGGHI